MGPDAVLAVADFGIAQFHPDDQETLVQTQVGTRLANFEYHAPEQRRAGGSIDARTDIFALGMMLNELTGEIPRGTGFRRIAHVAGEYGYLDEAVEAMMQSTPESRPASIAEVRRLLRLLHERAMTSTQIAALPTSVVIEGVTDDALIVDPPRLTDAKWDEGALTLTLSRSVNDTWIDCLRRRMGNWESLMGVGPEAFHFSGNIARAPVGHSDAQRVIDHFKAWIPKVTTAYEHHVASSRQRAAEEEMARVRREREKLELAQRINASLRI